MTTDLEARLQRYGTTLDNANQHRSGADSHPDQRPQASDVEVELGYVVARPRSRSRSLVGADAVWLSADDARVDSVPAIVADLRRSMATCGYDSLKEFQTADLVVVR